MQITEYLEDWLKYVRFLISCYQICCEQGIFIVLGLNILFVLKNQIPEASHGIRLSIPAIAHSRLMMMINSLKIIRDLNTFNSLLYFMLSSLIDLTFLINIQL